MYMCLTVKTISDRYHWGGCLCLTQNYIRLVGLEMKNREEEIETFMCVFDTRLFVIGVVVDEIGERRESERH